MPAAYTFARMRRFPYPAQNMRVRRPPAERSAHSARLFAKPAVLTGDLRSFKLKDHLRMTILRSRQTGASRLSKLKAGTPVKTKSAGLQAISDRKAMRESFPVGF